MASFVSALFAVVFSLFAMHQPSTSVQIQSQSLADALDNETVSTVPTTVDVMLATSPTSSIQTYRNTQYGLAIGFHPDTWQPRWSCDSYADFEKHESLLFCAALTRAFAQGVLTVGVSSSTDDVASCLLVPQNAQNAGLDITSAGQTIISGIPFTSSFISVSSAPGAPGEHETRYLYRTVRTNVCLTIQVIIDATDKTAITAAQIGNVATDYSKVKDELNSFLNNIILSAE
jgi:hypothetical protein